MEQLTSRVLVLSASRWALECAAEQLEDPATVGEYAALASLVDWLTVQRVATWLRRRSSLYADAVTSLGEAVIPVARAADARAQYVQAAVAGCTCGAADRHG